MITALISSVIGLISGVVPDIVSEVRSSNSHKRELQLLEKQTELQLKLVAAQGDARWEESQLALYTQQESNMKEYLQSLVQAQFAPTGVKWVDVLNSLIRPTTAALIMIMFMTIATIFSMGVVESYLKGLISAEVMAQTLWQGMVGEAVQAVLGFLFGYRSARKLPER